MEFKGEEMNNLFKLKYIQKFASTVTQNTAKIAQQSQPKQAKQPKQKKEAAPKKAAPAPKKEKKVASYLTGQTENKYAKLSMDEAIKMKKDHTIPLENSYQPEIVELHWQNYWEKQNYFKANPENVLNGSKKPYVMCLPPPNVTGCLHIGHGLTSAVEDAIIRRKRMQGYETLYLPGQDHAGIATHSVVEKNLMKTEGKTRHDLGREKFVDKIWEWKDSHGSQIFEQLKLLGASLDQSRFRFTMDDQLSTAVKDSFCKFYDMGLIYRANRLVNWSCKLKTAISDIEVEYIEFPEPKKMQVPGHDGWYTFGELTHFFYPLKDDPTRKIEIATTRLETMLGDTAVAVNSKDPRYKDLVGKQLQHPFFPDRHIPIIIDDELVDMEYGTGAVKITPAHDPNDFNCGQKHKLDSINILDDDGLINANGGKYQGMKRFDVRKQLEVDLAALGLLGGKTKNPMSIGICSRSKDIIEPLLRPQWYMKNPVAEKMIDVVNKDELKIEPEEFKKEWQKWLSDPRDWCISRQLWWGHRIPAYLVQVKGQKSPDYNKGDDWVVAETEEEALEKAAKKYGVAKDQITLKQDEDVLDTWYSSGLFPFSTMGWPNLEAPDFKAFFPNQILETGHDILFFWVARMVQMSLLLTNQLPFNYVYLHPIIRDADGKKMSKSAGNVIDPREIIFGCTLEDMMAKLHQGNLPEKEIKRCEKNHQKNFPEGIPACGSDSLRFSLLAYMQKSRFINLDLKRIIGYRESGNKVFQSVKFGILYIPKDYLYKPDEFKYSELSFLNQWIITKLNSLVKLMNEDFDNCDFGDVATQFMYFWKYDFCDVFVEACKPILAVKEGEPKHQHFDQTLHVLYTCLETGLKLLHPLMPFLTEELFQKLTPYPQKSETIVLAKYPEDRKDWENESIESDFKIVQDIGKAVRQMCAQVNLPPKITPDTYIITPTKHIQEIVTKEQLLITKLAKSSFVELVESAEKVPKGCIKSAARGDIEVHINIRAHIKIDDEVKRLQKKIAGVDKSIADIDKKRALKNYETKVPQNVREQDEKNRIEFEKQKEILVASLEEIKNL